MEGWKYRSRELLGAIFCYQKSNKKTNIFLKFVWNCFSDICLKCLNHQVRINKMVNEHTVDYHPSPSNLTSKIHSPIFIWTPKGIILSPKYFLDIFSNLYIAPWLRKSFKFTVLRLLKNTFVSRNIESVCFHSCLKAKLSPKLLLLPLQARWNYPFPPDYVFCIFPQQKGGGLWSWKNDQN